MIQLSHPYMTAGKIIALTIWTFFGKMVSLLFNTLFSFIVASLPKSKCLLISWLQLPSIMILEPKKIKSATASTFPPSIYHEVMNQMSWSSSFEYWVLSQPFHSPLWSSSKGSLVPLCFLPLGWYHLHIWVVDISSGNLDCSLWFNQPGFSHDELTCM